jgi:hypothetical protein
MHTDKGEVRAMPSPFLDFFASSTTLGQMLIGVGTARIAFSGFHYLRDRKVVLNIVCHSSCSS